MIGAQVLVGLIVAVRLYYFVKENPPALLEKRFGSKFLYALIYYFVNAESVIMFWVTFFVNMYWFCMYKLQDNAYILLPTLDSNLE